MVVVEGKNEWYERSTRILVEHALAKNATSATKAAKAEAKSRSANLSTSSDKKGVSFAGAAFQAEYFQSKFKKRGMLLYQVLKDTKLHFPPGELKVASIGGGPGTDASGLVWLQRELYPQNTFLCTLYDFEKSWKRYVKVLGEMFGEHVMLESYCCDVTVGLDSFGVNQKVEVDDVNLVILAYVCHETSIKARKNGLQFYKGLAERLPVGAVVVIMDVKGHSREDLGLVAASMGEMRTIEPFQLKGSCNAEVLVFQFKD